MSKRPTIAEALLDRALLGAALGKLTTWSTWIAVLKAAFALPLSEDERAVFNSVAGPRNPPTRRVRELWAIVGRRGGKSRIAALIADYIALFVKHKLAPGEVGMVLVLAASKDQATVVFNYALAFLESSPVLRREIANVTAGEIQLRNGLVLAIHANSFRSIRGRSILAIVLDEVAYFRDDTSATPDSEVYSAVLPGLATTNGMLIGISSPYRKVGLLHAKYKQHFGVDGDDVLVVQGSSKTFNPSLTDEIIVDQRLADPTAAASEWDAEFRADLVGFLDEGTVERAIDHNRPLELPPRPHPVYYKAFVDPSGGAIGGDAYTIAIAHKERDRFIVDLVRGRFGPFDPREVTEEYARLCRDYRIKSVGGDLYSHQWVQQAWRDCHVTYTPSDLNASMLYLEALPLFTRGLVSLPDHPALLRELRLLERIPGRVGKDQVSHPGNAHDDLANVVCGALRTLANYLGFNTNYAEWVDGVTNNDEADAKAAWHRSQFEQHIRNHFGGNGPFSVNNRSGRIIEWKP
jgi:Phage Terminase